jgi:hypothetical protein
VFLSRFTQARTKVDQARRYTHAGRVQLHVGGKAIRGISDCSDSPLGDIQVERSVDVVAWVD